MRVLRPKYLFQVVLAWLLYLPRFGGPVGSRCNVYGDVRQWMEIVRWCYGRRAVGRRALNVFVP